MQPLQLNLLRTAPLALALSSLLGHAEVREITSYRDVTPLTDTSTLVVFDLDNTIFEPTQTLGSDQWGSLQQKRFKAQGLPPADAVDQGVAMFSEVQMKTRVQLVEPLTAGFIADLQKRGFRVMGLTARPMNLVARTVDELQSVGVNLAATAPEGIVPVGSDARHEVQYRGGVLFVGPHNLKGPVLKDFLKGQMPTSIRFFDDKKHHVDDLEEVFASLTDYVGYRYGAADAKVKSMSAELGDFEWKAFKLWNVILDDDSARELMRSTPETIPDVGAYVDAAFLNSLADSSDGDFRSEGCISVSDDKLHLGYRCKGRITSLVHGGFPFESEVVVTYDLYRETATTNNYLVQVTEQP